MTRFTDLDLDAVRSICARLRPQDAIEIEATAGPFTAEGLAAAFCDGALAGLVAWAGGEPAAVIACHPCVPGVGAIGMVATPAWPWVAAATTRQVATNFLPRLAALGLRRIEARSLASHHVAHRWMERFGAVREAVCRDFGQGGEDFHLYALTGLQRRRGHLRPARGGR